MAVLLPLTIIPTLLMGWIVFTRARALMLEQISERMRVFSSQATGEVSSWLLDKNLALDRLSRNVDFQQNLETLLQLSPTTPEYSSLQNEILSQLREMNPVGVEPIFNYLMFLDNQGKIIVSSNNAWENLDLSQEPYYQNKIISSTRLTFIDILPKPFYIDDSTYNLDVVMMTSLPITNTQNEPIGHFLGLSASPSLQANLELNSSFLPENNIFIINDSEKFAGITDLTTVDSFAPETPSAGQLALINRGPSNTALASSYTTYDGEQVLGLYSFYDLLNIGVIVETPSKSVLGPIESFAPFAVGIMVATVFGLAVLIYLGSRRISEPLKELSTTTQDFAEGNWEARASIRRKDEIGQLADSFNSMAEELANIYRRMEDQVEQRTRQMVTATEVASLATTSTNLDELLNSTAALITNRFNFHHVAVYLLDEPKETGHLRAATGLEGKNLLKTGHQIKIAPNTIYQWIVKNNKSMSISNTDEDVFNLGYESLADVLSKAAFPISIGSDVFGFIDVQSVAVDTFSLSAMEVLQTLANQLATAIQNYRLLEGSEIDLQQVSKLYHASQRVAQASTYGEILHATIQGLQQTSFYSAIYLPEDNVLKLLQPAENKPFYADRLPPVIPISNSTAKMFFEIESPLIIRNLVKPSISIRPELLDPARDLNAQETALIPIMVGDELEAIIILASRETGKITQNSLSPILSFVNLVTTGIEKVQAFQHTRQSLRNLEILNTFSNQISMETDPDKLYYLLHEQIKEIVGDVDFYVALYDSQTNHIEIPYLFEGEEKLSIDPFPLGEGLTSIVVRTRQPLMLVENAEERAKALGAKIVGTPARSWLGVPLIVAGEIIGIVSIQDVETEHRFTEEDLALLVTLSPPIAAAIHSAQLLAESQQRAYQLQTVAEISQETSATLDLAELLKHAVQLVQDRFNFYHASVFLIDPSGEYAVIQESTGEAGHQMKKEGHKLKIGSQSIIGNVTANRKPLVVNDVTQVPTHKFNPLLPDTRAELGIPIMIGGRVLGALDVQSTVPYAFSQDDVDILQILADQLAVAITNANLFTETQEHLAQHRLIHHVTSVAASSTNIEDALSSAVQGLRVTLGDFVSILLVDKKNNILRISASSGYEDDLIGTQFEMGQGIVGWVAEHSEALIVNDVRSDPRYIPAKESVRSELAVPLVFRGELLGVLNIESEFQNAYDEHDQDIIGTLAGSLSAIIVNARLSERQRQLFDITSKIRQSVNMDTILQTTANELTKALRTQRTRIQVGGKLITPSEPTNGQEGDE